MPVVETVDTRFARSDALAEPNSLMNPNTFVKPSMMVKPKGHQASRPASTHASTRATLAVLLALSAMTIGVSASHAFERIGVIAPLGDRHAILGQQAVEGAREALNLPKEAVVVFEPEAGDEEVGDEVDAGVNVEVNGRAGEETVGLEESPDPVPEVPEPASPWGVELIAISDPCRGGDNAAADGALVASRILEADLDAVVGLICWPTLEAALEGGTLDGIPLVTSGARAGALTDRRRREGWSVWRVAPRVEDEAEAIADHIFAAWRTAPYAIIDDGTIYGRELAETVSLELGQRGSEPVHTETYRPAVSRQFGVVRRLEASGAGRVFVAGERRDVAIIARDAVAAGLDLDILGGDAMRAVDDETPLPAGVEGMLLEPALREGYRLTTRAAVETLLQAEDLAEARGFSLEDALNTGEFGTAIGSVRFDRLGDLRRNLFALHRWNGEAWVAADS